MLKANWLADFGYGLETFGRMTDNVQCVRAFICYTD